MVRLVHGLTVLRIVATIIGMGMAVSIVALQLRPLFGQQTNGTITVAEHSIRLRQIERMLDESIRDRTALRSEAAASMAQIRVLETRLTALEEKLNSALNLLYTALTMLFGQIIAVVIQWIKPRQAVVHKHDPEES